MEVKKKSNQGLVIALVIMIFLLVGCLGYGVYKYLSLDKEYDKLNNENKSINEQIEKQKDTVSDNSNNSSTSYKDMYLDVLAGNHKYVNKDGKEVSISEFGNEDWHVSIPSEGKIEEYALVDMDGDGTEELVAIVSAYDEFVLILHYEDGQVYGFEDGHRAMTMLKTNGYYYGSCGADCGTVLKSSFSKNVRTQETLADNSDGSYKINNKKASKNEYDKFLDKFNNYKDVSWIKY